MMALSNASLKRLLTLCGSTRYSNYIGPALEWPLPKGLGDGSRTVPPVGRLDQSSSAPWGEQAGPIRLKDRTRDPENAPL
jgi:hypothetical protein